MTRKILLCALVLAACSSASGQSGPAPTAAAAPAPAAAPAGPPPAPAPITLASRPQAGPGERAYVEKCIMCHGPNGMGTGLLARRMKVALLEERTDLGKRYVIFAARSGVGNMPAVPRGEVSDAEMELIADYLTRKRAP